MPGKFVNESQKITIDAITSNMQKILNNPYYLYNDKRATVVDYWNINTARTTLDEATRNKYSELDPDSPIRYNLIKNFYVYGIDRVNLDFDVGEFGVEANEITGEVVILPNTIIPYPGDYFKIHHLDKPYLFSVTKVDQNTLDTGVVMYRLSYKLEYTDLHGIDKQTVEDYNMIPTNIGTNFKAVIQSSKYDLIRELESYTTKLKDYYNMIFYDKRVQTYTFLYNNLFKVYDPYLIEFMIRNKIINGATEYHYVSHQMTLPNTFGIDYDKTIFAAFENKDIYRSTIQFVGNMLECTQPLSLLTAYKDKYYYMEYKQLSQQFHSINVLDLDIIDKIRCKIYEPNAIFNNIIVKYFNDEELTNEDAHSLGNVDYSDNISIYYKVPICIYCIERIITDLMRKEDVFNG